MEFQDGIAGLKVESDFEANTNRGTSYKSRGGTELRYLKITIRRSFIDSCGVSQ